MFSDFADSGNAILIDRLQKLEESVRSLQLSTREEYQAAVTSLLNRALILGNRVSPLIPFAPEGPAKIGDIAGNLKILNEDAGSILKQLLSVEDEVGRLYNLFASTHNSQKQLVREMVYISTRRKYQEVFINDRQLDQSTAYVDFGAAVVSLPLLSDTQVIPSKIELGVTSTGTLETSVSDVADGLAHTSMVWNGQQVELLITFDQPTIVNRVIVELDEYQGLNLEIFSTSPDGIVREDILAEMNTSLLAVDGSSNKFAGDWIADFDARHVKQMRLAFSDRVGTQRIAIRGLRLYSRRFAASATLQTKKIEAPEKGRVLFNADQSTADELTSITHQISYDGVHYSAITPGQELDIPSNPYWYRAFLERMDGNFDSKSSPISSPGDDPSLTDHFKINATTSYDLGNNVLERAISIDVLAVESPNTARILKLRESPLPGTLAVYQGPYLLGLDEYQVLGNSLKFIGTTGREAVTIRYQTSAFATAGLATRKEYYTPRLHQVSFERVY